MLNTTFDNIISIFPKQVYVCTNDVIPKEEHEYLLLLDYIAGTQFREQNTSINKYVLNDTPNIKSFIEHHLFWYFQNIYATHQKIKITQSWCVKDDKLAKHHHRNSLISGVYYVDVDSEDDRLILYNDTPSKKFFDWGYDETLGSKNPGYWDWTGFNIQKGKLILFPSYMEHSSVFNSNSRCVLAFNTWFDGSFGVNTMLSETIV